MRVAIPGVPRLVQRQADGPRPREFVGLAAGVKPASDRRERVPAPQLGYQPGRREAHDCSDQDRDPGPGRRARPGSGTT
jgi:hypothetical protein